MKNIELNLSSIKDFFAKFGKNLTWIFFGVFLLLLVFEVFQIKNSVDIVLNTNQTPPPPATEKGVRINFPAYDGVVQRITDAPNFQPSQTNVPNPFAAPVPASAN